MTIGNGSIVLAADLNAMALPALSLLQADNARLPGGAPISLCFPGLVAGLARYRTTKKIVIPVDMLVEAIAVQTSPATAASTITVDITGDGALPNFAMRVTGTLAAAGVTKQARLLFDGSQTNMAKGNVDPALTSRVPRLLSQGGTITVIVSTTNVLATMAAQVVIIGRSRLARGTA